LILGAIGEGVSRVQGFLEGRDCHATLRVIRELGVRVEGNAEGDWYVHGCGLHGLQEPNDVLDCANSGTTIRLVCGLLAGRPFTSVLTGTDQLRGRPMARVTEPLRKMGAAILDRKGGLAPLAIRGAELEAIEFSMPVASAQVKSAVLLAGLQARGTTTVVEPGPSRDHTERMLGAMGAPVVTEGRRVQIRSPQTPLAPFDLRVPGDPSSAAFVLVAAAAQRGSSVVVQDVATNPTRIGLVEALRQMGARIDLERPRSEAAEPVADLRVTGDVLYGTSVGGEAIVTMIDEIPILAVAATQAMGTTTVTDAAELRVKETDRIATTVTELTKLGAQIEARPDGMVIHGPSKLVGTDVNSHGDHRLAMALAVAGLFCQGETRVHGSEVISDSFPGFVDVLRGLGAEVSEP